jgi:hypothetical protein
VTLVVGGEDARGRRRGKGGKPQRRGNGKDGKARHFTTRIVQPVHKEYSDAVTLILEKFYLLVNVC